MKVLLITPYLPYPLTEGGKVSQFSVIDYIRRKLDVTLSFVIYDDEVYANMIALQKLIPDVDMQFLDIRKPAIKYKNLHRFLVKVANGLNRFKNRIANEKTGSQEFKVALLENNISTAISQKYILFLENLIKERSFDVVQVDHVAYMSLGIILSKLVPCVFMHQELVFAKIISDIQKSQAKETVYGTYLADLALSQEKALLSWYDATMVFSNTDKIKLETAFNNSYKVYTSQFSVLDGGIVTFSKEDCIIKKLVFVGGDIHHPNIDAIDWYIKEIANKVVSNTGLQLHIIGNWHESTKSIRQSESVVFAGFVDDLVAYCRNSIMLVPVRIGSGIRTKMMYAMAQGTPVISTYIGAEGIIAEAGSDYLQADTPEQFIEQIKILFNQPEYVYEIATKAQDAIKRTYTREISGEKRIEIYKEIIAGRQLKQESLR